MSTDRKNETSEPRCDYPGCDQPVIGVTWDHTTNEPVPVCAEHAGPQNGDPEEELN